jgi:hypothetical protein
LTSWATDSVSRTLLHRVSLTLSSLRTVKRRISSWSCIYFLNKLGPWGNYLRPFKVQPDCGVKSVGLWSLPFILCWDLESLPHNSEPSCQYAIIDGYGPRCDSFAGSLLAAAAVCSAGGFHVKRDTVRCVPCHLCHRPSRSLFVSSSSYLEALGSNVGPENGYPVWSFSHFYSSLSGKYGESTLHRPQLLTSSPFPILYSLIIQPFDYVQLGDQELATASNAWRNS